MRHRFLPVPRPLSAFGRAQKGFSSAFRAFNLGRSAIERPAMTKDTYRDLLLTELDRSEALRARTEEDAAFSEKRGLLRVWQAGRLARTHQRPSGQPPLSRRGEILPGRHLRPDRPERAYRGRAPDRASDDARPARTRGSRPSLTRWSSTRCRRASTARWSRRSATGARASTRRPTPRPTGRSAAPRTGRARSTSSSCSAWRSTS